MCNQCVVDDIVSLGLPLGSLWRGQSLSGGAGVEGIVPEPVSWSHALVGGNHMHTCFALPLSSNYCNPCVHIIIVPKTCDDLYQKSL